MTSDTPQRVLIESRVDLRASVLLLILRARRELRLAATDLALFSLADQEVCAGLRTMLLANRSCRVRLLVDDLTWLETRAARLRALQREFSHALLIRRADPEDPVGEERIAIGDATDALRLRPTMSLNGELWCNNAPFVQPLAATFERCWQHAAHNVAVVPLGL